MSRTVDDDYCQWCGRVKAMCVDEPCETREQAAATLRVILRGMGLLVPPTGEGRRRLLGG